MVLSKKTLAIGTLLVGCGASVLWLSARRTDAPSAGSPDSENWYVGPSVCTECHAGEALRHARSGHARTIRTTRDFAEARALDGKVFRDEERGLSFHYHVTDEGLHVTAPEKFGDREFPLEYAIGSGDHATGFLTLIQDGDGRTVGIEHRVSMYAPDHRLGLAPSQAGLKPVEAAEYFGRPIAGDKLLACLDCHVTTAAIGDDGLHDLQMNVSCEKCHGPGGRHVEAVAAHKEDLAIRLGKGSLSAVDQLRFCGKCHRHPETTNETIVAAVNPALARFQPIGLSQSACFKKSSGNLKCTTCHDPHEHVERERETFESRCVECHGGSGAKSRPCPVSPQANCIPCHMPPVEVRPGTVFHDHWIRIQEAAPKKAEGAAADGAP